METDNNTSLRVDSFSYYLDTAKDKTTTNPTKQPLSIKFSKPKETQGNASLRVDSLSYHLNSGDNFVFEVPGPTQDPTSAFTFSHAPKDGEIGVFNADKYFNMKLEYQTQAKSNESRPVNLARIGPSIGPRTTPSLSSEASSCNSRTTFLPGHKTESLTKHKTAIGRRIFTGFGCRGPCFDRKSVHINEIGSERRNQLMIKVDDQVDQSRPSIEVFGSSTTSSKGDVATNMGRKLSMLTWDAIPKGRTLPTSTVSCDDMASEASSDLFEIENISGSIYPLTSEPVDDMSSFMSPTSVYAPSETSIQWSVVTASAADYSAVLDYNDESVSVAGDRAVAGKMVSNRAPKMRNGEVKKSGPAGLLGCKSHKAVDVAENIVCFKATEKVKNQG